MKQKKIIRTKLSNGITIIALVITIIALLILAGVSIATLTGENGLLSKVDEAKVKTGVGEEKEQITIAYNGAMINTKGEEVTATKLQEQLIANGVNVTAEDTNGDIKVTFTDTKNNYWIEANGNITDIEPFHPEALAIGTAINGDKYGCIVTNYTVKTKEGPDGTSENSGVWRLFYQDSKYTYIITDDLVGSYMPSDYYSSYTDGSKVSTVGQKLSPTISSLFTTLNKNENIRSTAWLTDPEVWKSYKKDDAVFAIGAPTAELFAASYNIGKDNSITLELGTYGYTENTDLKWFVSSDNGGIYNYDDSSNWWLASPDDYGTRCGFAISNYNGNFDNDRFVTYRSFPVRPVVCIQTSVFNNNYTLGNM